MNRFFVIYEIICVSAFALCWLGGLICILVVIVQAIRSAGTLGPRFVFLFIAQSRSDQLPPLSRRAMLLARRFQRWGFRAWCAGVAGMVIGIICALFAESAHAAMVQR